MAYYIKKDKKEPEKEQKPYDTRERRFFFQIVGCVIVLIIFLIIWAVKHG